MVAGDELLQAVTAAARAAVISTAGLLIFTGESPIALSGLPMEDAGRTRRDYRPGTDAVDARQRHEATRDLLTGTFRMGSNGT